MKTFPWRVLLPPVALLLQLLAFLGLRAVWTASYSEPRAVSEPLELIFTRGLLAAAAATGFVLGGLGTYRLIARSRLLVALPMIAAFSMPTFLCASVYLYALLWFLALA